MQKKSYFASLVCLFMLSPCLHQAKALDISFDTENAVELAQNKRRQKSANPKRVNKTRKQELIYALRMARNQNYLEASKALFSLSRNAKYRKERQQIKYILGLMLSELGLYQMAAYQYVGVIQSGDTKYINKALEKLTIAADILEDERLLNYSMTKIDLKKFPKDQWDMLRYRIGQVYAENGDLAGAVRYFNKVPERSSFFTRAKYHEALSYAEAGKPEQAIQAFASLIRTRDEYGDTDPVRVGAFMGLARTYYQAKDWDKAIELYKRIPRNSEFWHQSLFELSWAQMRSGKFRSVLSNFHTLHSSYYELNYLPESLLLRGIVYLYICKYDEMEKTLDTFRQIYLPVANQIKIYLARKPKPKDIFSDFDKFVRDYEDYAKAISKDEYMLPSMILKHIYDQGDIRAIATYLYKLRRERDLILSKPSDWRAAQVGKTSLDLINKRIRGTEDRMGRQIRKYLLDIMDEIASINEQEEFARFEMTNSEKESLRSKMLQGEPESSSIDQNVSRDVYTENGYEYWPFRGEYWLDEIGNYHYLGVSSCR